MLFQNEKVKYIRIHKKLSVYHETRNQKRIIDERKRSQNRLFGLIPPISRNEPSEKVSFGTFFCLMRKASLAVETALVLPVFFLGVITIISLMNVYQMQTEHLSKLCENAKKVGMHAYVTGESAPAELTVPDVYSYEPVGGLIPLPRIWMHNTVKVHTWTGVEYDSFQDGSETEAMVYVTESGNVYHKSLGCTYLNLSVTEAAGTSVTSMRNDYGEHYEACEICSRNQKPAGRVFITKKSNRYHNLETCSGLKRSVRLVKESEAADLGACSRCG